MKFNGVDVTVFAQKFEGEIARHVPSGVLGDRYDWSVCLEVDEETRQVLIMNANKVDHRDKVEQLRKYLFEREFAKAYAERKGRFVEYPLYIR